MQAAVAASSLFDSVDPEYLEERRVKLESVVEAFAGEGLEIDGKVFMKLCKDTKLVGKKLTVTDVDLIFSKVKDKDVRKINMSQFRNAMDEIATKRGCRRDDVVDLIIAAGGPIFEGTRAEDQGSIATPLKQVKPFRDGPSDPDAPLISAPSLPRMSSSASGKSPKSQAPLTPAQETLRVVFGKYTAPYNEMDGKAFAKVAKDAGLIDKALTMIDIDIFFAKVKDKAARRINPTQFEDGVALMAQKRGLAFEAIVKVLMDTDGPVFEGTEAEASRFSERAAGSSQESPNAPVYLNGKPMRSMSSKLLSPQAPQQPRKALSSEVQDAFRAFAASGEMDGKAFSKVARDAQLVDRACSNIDIDLIFAKVKPKGERKLSVEQFDDGLAEIAARKGVDYQTVVDAVAACGGPQFVGTKGDTFVATELRQKGEGGIPRTSSSRSSAGSSVSSRPGTAHVQQQPALEVPGERMDALRALFLAFSPAGEMEGKTLQKLIRDAGLLGDALTMTDVDLIFAKVKHFGSKRLEFDQFVRALAEFAKKTGREHLELSQAVLDVGGPQFSGTKMDAVKFYDDKSLFTGMYGDDDTRQAAVAKKQQAGVGPKAPEVDDSEDLRWVFRQYCPNDEMEGKTFAKMVRDAGLLDKQLTMTEVDLIFAKVKTASSQRKIVYLQFLKALGHMALKKAQPVDLVVDKLVSAGGPQFYGTVAGANKFHDDKSLYTGMHAAEEDRDEQAKPQARRMVISNEPASSLQEVFLRFSPTGEMDGKTFAKVAKDSGVLDKALTMIDIDIFFAKVKDKAARKISYEQFESGVREMAEKKKVPFEAIAKELMLCGGPVIEGTVAEKNKFHDDKSLYTGMHGREDGYAAQLDTPPPRPKTAQVEVEVGYGPADSLEEVFELFSPSGEMDGRSFAKMIKDARLLDKGFAPPDVDLIFAKAKAKGVKLSFRQFNEALEAVAQRKKIEFDALAQIIMDAGGPRLVGTHAEPNKFHDDKTTYTGSHGR